MIVNIACLFKGNYWSNAHNRRNYFIEFASQKGFDPLVAINWENIRYKEIIKQVKREKKLRKDQNEGRLN